ncbi:universal stress protein [Massilia niastensis]|uniref:universal stress protein n=1 Tax=Massilia niastensis TaxID=544911 RepID=UPI0003604C1B|nr:universal stress protein [Massilia niastensis]
MFIEKICVATDGSDLAVRAARVSCETATTLSSSAGPEIVRAAEAHACDLIVMGAHGPNDGGKRYAGSVAQHALAYSSIPGLALRDPRETAPPEFTDEPTP